MSSAESPPEVTYIFTWHSLSDACEKCRMLNGHEYHHQDIFQETVFDPIWGDIWNLTAGHSLAHGDKAYNCRCQLEVRVEVDMTENLDYSELTSVTEMML